MLLHKYLFSILFHRLVKIAKNLEIEHWNKLRTHLYIYSIFSKWINYFIIDYKIISKRIVNDTLLELQTIIVHVYQRNLPRKREKVREESGGEDFHKKSEDAYSRVISTFLWNSVNSERRAPTLCCVIAHLKNSSLWYILRATGWLSSRSRHQRATW